MHAKGHKRGEEHRQRWHRVRVCDRSIAKDALLKPDHVSKSRCDVLRRGPFWPSLVVASQSLLTVSNPVPGKQKGGSPAPIIPHLQQQCCLFSSSWSCRLSARAGWEKVLEARWEFSTQGLSLENAESELLRDSHRFQLEPKLRGKRSPTASLSSPPPMESLGNTVFSDSEKHVGKRFFISIYGQKRAQSQANFRVPALQCFQTCKPPETSRLIIGFGGLHVISPSNGKFGFQCACP